MAFDIAQIRAQFPALHQKVEGGGCPVFFDNPAGTQVPQAVIDAVTDYYKCMNANAGGVFATSHRNDAMVQSVRECLVDFLNAPSIDEIVFGPNMTTLIFGLSRALARTLSPGDEIVLTRMDHDANIAPWLLIAEDRDLVVRWVDIVASDCTLDMNTLEAALTERTKIVATVHASNAVGTVNPVRQIADMAHAAGALYVVDAVQSAPHVPIDVQAMGCDFLFCSAYKFYGPHIGIMWGRYDLLSSLPAYKVRPAKNYTPYRWETGTPSFETIAGVGSAISYLASTLTASDANPQTLPGLGERKLKLNRAMAALAVYERELATHLIEVMQDIPGVTIAGITDPARYEHRVPTIAFVRDGYEPSAIAQHLAQQHIYVWVGNYYAQEIMERLGHGEHGMVRIGLSHYNTHEEIDHLAAALRIMDKSAGAK